MTTPTRASLALLCAVAVLGLALTVTSRSFGASRRHPRLPAPPTAVDAALLSQIARAQAAAAFAQQPHTAVTALCGL